MDEHGVPMSFGKAIASDVITRLKDSAGVTCLCQFPGNDCA